MRGFLGVDRLNLATGQSENLSSKGAYGLWGTQDAFALSANGELVAGRGETGFDGAKFDDSGVGKIDLLNVRTSSRFKRLDGHPAVQCLAFSPDNKLLASGGGDNLSKVWDVATGQLLRTLRTYRDVSISGVASVAFNPKGDLLASGGEAILIYFAGHGAAQQKRFYLIPHDLGYTGARTALDRAGLDSIFAHSISDRELEAAVEGLDASQVILIIDACNSGQALEAEEKRRGPMNSAGLAQLAYEKGMYILTAAQGFQAAQEAQRLGHGYLTYALVEEGLKTSAADANKDGQVLLREWLDYATERVPRMQQERLTEANKQAPTTPTATRLLVQHTNPSVEGMQQPRVFYRRELETQPLVVVKP